MNDLQTINDIIGSAIRDSSYTTVLISSCVFIIYTLIIRLVDLFKTKSRHKPLIEMAAAIKEVSENVVKLNTVLDKTIKEAEAKASENVKLVVSLALDSFRVNISKLCEDIIIHNNIDKNKELVSQNIYKLISTEYYKLYSIFSAYQIDNINVSTRLKEEWIEEITKECLSIIYNGQDGLTRIGQINNKLLISANQYSIYINNKVFNH